MTTREQFEAWKRSINPGILFLRHDHNGSNLLGQYASMILEDQWQAWQASRAAALEEAAKECEQMQKHFDTQDAIYAAEQCAMGIRALKD